MNKIEITGIKSMPTEKYDVNSERGRQIINETVARKLGTLKTQIFTDVNTLEKSLHYMGPDYCHSIAAAWEIIEFVNGDIYCLRKIQATGKWICNLGGDRVEADTAPIAICLAFLKLPNES